MTAPVAARASGPAGRADGQPGSPARGRRLAAALVRQARPRQWLKNVLVLAAPAAAGELASPGSVVRVAVAVVAFCLAASGTYYVNDLLDRDADRLHPVKRGRPVAAGLVPVRLGWAVGVALLVAAVGVAALTGWLLPVVVLAYVALTTGYSTYLKHVAAVDLVAVAGGFVLRALGGAAAVEVPVSRWFLIVTSLGSLFVVAAKRKAELRALGAEGAVRVRTSHAAYSAGYLDHVMAMSSGAVVVSYCLWAFERQGATDGGVPFFVLSVLPFVLGLLRYALLVDGGAGEEPEELALADRTLLWCAAALAVLVLLGVAAA